MPAPSPDLRSVRAPWVGLGVAVLLVVAAIGIPALTGWNVHVNHFPPLHADWDPRVGVGTPVAVLLAVLGCWQAPRLARTLPWGRLLLVSYVAGLAWMLALAFVDGSRGVSEILQEKYEYLPTARTTSDLPSTLQTYISRIPFFAGALHWPPHLAGHPPGALVFFVALVRIGLGGGFAAGLVVTLIAASTSLAVLVTTRLLGAEAMARKAAPLLVLGPAAIWQCVSADGMFAAVVAWGVTALAVSATRRSWWWVAWAVLAGLLLGYAVMLSYGLPIAGVLALAVLLLARSWRPLLPAVLAALAVVGAFAALGFDYLAALPVIHQRYWAGVARNRPASYWLWGDFAAFALSAGPLAGAGVAAALARPRAWWRDPQTRVVLGLGGAGALMAVFADLSLMSKGEVERIWLPFAPWLLLTTALLPAPWRRAGLALQLVIALVLQHLLSTGW